MSEFQTGDGSPDDASVTAQAQEKVQQTAQQASQKAGQYLRQQTEARAGQVSDELRSVADALRRSGNSLHADGKETPGNAVDQVTQGLERLSSYLGETSADRLVQDIESFGRRRPWGMIGIGLGLGLVASRFLKASSQTRYESSRAQQQFQPPTQPMLPPAPSEPATQVGYVAYSGDGR